MICYQCENEVMYLFADSRCKDCTRLTPDEVVGNVISTKVRVTVERIEKNRFQLTVKGIDDDGNIKVFKSNLPDGKFYLDMSDRLELEIGGSDEFALEIVE